MTVTSDQLTADRDREFDDWSEPVVLRRVTQTFDPETQQIGSAFEDFNVSAIVGTLADEPLPDAGAQARTVDLIVRVKREDFPGSNGAVNWRVLYASLEYDVIEQTTGPAGHTIELRCRKVA